MSAKTLGNLSTSDIIKPTFRYEAVLFDVRPRPLAKPPLRPAAAASSGVNSWAVPFSCAALPPLLAISRCLTGSMDANPRLLFPGALFPELPLVVAISPSLYMAFFILLFLFFRELYNVTVGDLDNAVPT